jgi:integrase
MKLKQSNVDKLQLPSGKTDHIEWDDDLPGFGLRIRAGGSRVYVVQYKVGAKNRRMTLGSTKKLHFEPARKEAKKLLGRVGLGQDPQGDKATARATASETFKAIAERFIAYQAKRLRPSSLYSTSLYLMARCKRLHDLKLEAVTRREIASVLSTIATHSGAVSADRARAALSAMFAWSMREGLCETNPTIATNTFAGAVKRDRVLTKDEIVAIWSALPDNDYGRIVKLLFYTGARPDEIGGLTWAELTPLDDRLIRLPAERSKNKRAFDLPLSQPASDLIANLEQREGRGHVFGKRNSGFQGWSKAKRELDAKLKGVKPWQLRDIRRTVATGMAEIGVQPHIVEAVLNHVSGAKAGVAGVYNKAVYAKEKREAVEIWANHIAVILAQASGANVTRIADRA